MLLALFLLLLLLWGFLQTDTGQNWLARRITGRLSKDLQTRISIRHVNIGLFSFNKLNLEGVLVEDRKKDTLLYAGNLQVRITDWFFFKDKAELKYVGLDDAVVYLNRTDSVWNYGFLEDYFSSGPTDTTKKKDAGIRFDLKKLVMNRVHFIQHDAWTGSDLEARIKALDLDANDLSLSGKTIDIDHITLDQPYIALYSYKGRNTDTTHKSTPATASSTPAWNIRLGSFTIRNGRFKDDIQTANAPLPYFDSQHMDFSSINATFKNVGWTADTLTGNIDLSAQERSGLVVKSLKAKTTIHPKAMIFDQLHLQTNRSTLTNYFSMRYSSIASLDNFLHAVTLEARFDGATISSDDIAFFAPDLREWKKNLRLNGTVKGTIDALASKDLELWAGSNTYIHGAVSLVGLPNINETLINIEAQDLRTTYNDAASFIPDVRRIKTPNLSRISYLRFKGTYTGFINDFVTYGTLQTNLGTLTTDLNMKFPARGEPVYSGRISTDGFQLGSFINSPSLGLVAFDGSVKGKGFQWQTLDMSINGSVKRIQYGDYFYRNITARGSFTNRIFNGDFMMKDANADMHLKGLVDLSAAKPVFRVSADIARADLKGLQITPQDMQLSGHFDLDMQASSLSNMTGTARITNATVTSNGRQLSFDSLVVSSNYINGQKRLTAVSNEFNATLTGDFDMQGLPDAFTLFLSRYYPAYIRAPRSVKPQIFTFDITTGVVEDYLKLIDNRLSGFNNSHVTGSLNTTANTMTVDADIPHFSFRQYDFSDVQLQGSGDLQKLVLTGQVANAQVGDSLLFPQTNFSIEAQNDVSKIMVNTTSNQAINRANLSAQIQTFSDGVSILFNPSSFVLNGKTWSLEQGGELNFRRNTVLNGGVVLRESNQEIKLWTQLADVGSGNNLHVAFQNVNIGDFSPFLTKQNRIEGILNGEAVVEDPQRLNVSSDLRITELRIDDDTLGNINAQLHYNNKTGQLSGKLANLDPEHQVSVDLSMNLSDSLSMAQNRIHAQLTNFELKYLNRFLNGIFSDITGYVTGNFDILGSGSNTAYLAKARVHDAGFKVGFTQVSYKIDDTELSLKRDTIDLNNIRLRDRFGNTAIVKGNIIHHAFADMRFDIDVLTESKQMELINTTYNDNQQFYGRAMGSGEFTLLGRESDMYMNVNIKASETDSSYITLPPSRTRESGQASFMVERKYGREMTPESLGAAANLTYDIRLSATPLVNVSVVLDELTGDAIKGRGTGNLQLTSGTSAPLTLQGRYNIDAGSYEFTFQSFLKKPFQLKEGGNNYIEWNGDPYDATVHLEAIYTAEKVSFAPLASTLFSNTNYSSLRDNVNVVATLAGNLFHPSFDFKLEFPSNNVIYSKPDFTFALQQIEKNPNELNKQVTYLIVFNSFAPFENTTATGFNPFGEFTYNTISGLLFGKVNEQLNRILSKILRNNNATLNFTGSLYNRNLVDPNSKNVFRLPDQSNVSLSLGLPLFNDRAHFTIGATVDVPLQSDFQQTVRLFPDVTLELLVNKSGSVRASFFYRENMDFFVGNTPTGIIPRRYGASIGYGKEFDSLGDLFGKKKARPQKDSLPAAVDSTGTH